MTDMPVKATCSGQTWKGVRCKSTALDDEGRCESHPKRRCTFREYQSPCGAKIKGDAQACPRHLWLLDETEISKKANLLAEELRRQGHAVEFARQELGELSGKVRLAKLELSALEKSVARMMDKRRDADLLTRAEGLDADAMASAVSLVRERRMQRSEGLDRVKGSKGAHRAASWVDADEGTPGL